ncbi:class I SAM-dependent methyltransferase [Cohnella sp. 56]|uniref:class I SAM-dependent methyltransferase n=1 Tax=Cohnella sp. 56 TaxID=3113722 RepID=UPI0030E9E1C3
MNKFIHTRAEEIKYHQKFYSENALFATGTWLARPVKVVLEMLDIMDLNELQVLDLGCGVGRNSIPIAEKVKAYNGMITCVDLLQTAIDYLIENSKTYDVQHNIIAQTADVETYSIQPNSFDYIVACSCLEHLSSVDAFKTIVNGMILGTKNDGINAILMSTENQDFFLETGELKDGLIELNLKTDEAFSLLHELYKDWEIMIERQSSHYINEHKYGTDIEFRSNWITFIARKKNSSEFKG